MSEQHVLEVAELVGVICKGERHVWKYRGEQDGKYAIQQIRTGEWRFV